MDFYTFVKNIPTIENTLGYSFNNKDLLVRAFTHKSICNNTDYNYERLEFYGDSVLAYIATYRKLNNINVNKSFNKMLENNTLANDIEIKGLNKFVIKTDNSTNRKINADIFESILCAIALDSNWNLDKLNATYSKLTNKEVRNKGLLKRINSINNNKKD